MAKTDVVQIPNDVDDSTNLETHPHAVMGDFVRTYETIIKPAILRGDVGDARAPILEASINHGRVFTKNYWGAKNGTQAPYSLAVTYLQGLSDEVKGVDEERKKKIINSLIHNIDRQVSELDIILQGDKIYEEQVHREDWALSGRK